MVLLDVVMKKVQTQQPISKESLDLLIAGNAAFEANNPKESELG